MTSLADGSVEGGVIPLPVSLLQGLWERLEWRAQRPELWMENVCKTRRDKGHVTSWRGDFLQWEKNKRGLIIVAF